MLKIIVGLMVAGTLLMVGGIVAEVATAPGPDPYSGQSSRSTLPAEDWLLDWAVRIRRELP